MHTLLLLIVAAAAGALAAVLSDARTDSPAQPDSGCGDPAVAPHRSAGTVDIQDENSA